MRRTVSHRRPRAGAADLDIVGQQTEQRQDRAMEQGERRHTDRLARWWPDRPMAGRRAVANQHEIGEGAADVDADAIAGTRHASVATPKTVPGDKGTGVAHRGLARGSRVCERGWRPHGAGCGRASVGVGWAGEGVWSRRDRAPARARPARRGRAMPPGRYDAGPRPPPSSGAADESPIASRSTGPAYGRGSRRTSGPPGCRTRRHDSSSSGSSRSASCSSSPPAPISGSPCVRTYPIYGASGVLGPKLSEGDRQVPEGIYTIAYMNPNSISHLSLALELPQRLRMVAARRRTAAPTTPWGAAS